jgi:hypothetical protein
MLNAELAERFAFGSVFFLQHSAFKIQHVTD